MTWFVYLLQCGDGRLYTGITDDMKRRLTEHRQGRGGRFTKGVPPVELLYKEAFDTPDEAKRREQQLKGWTRVKKIALITGDRKVLKEA